MTAVRKTPAPSNSIAPLAGADTLEKINTEVKGLWQYSSLPLTNVAGTANAITADCVVPLDDDLYGQCFKLLPTLQNTAAATLNIDGKGAKPLVSRDGSALVFGRLLPGLLEIVFDNGTEYRLLNEKPSINAAPLTASFVYQLASGALGAVVQNSWNDYPLNTVVLNDIPGLAFDTVTKIFTLAAGTYELEAICNFGECTAVGLFWWDVVAGAPVTVGFNRTNSYYYGARHLSGKINLITQKTFKLRYYAQTGGGYIGNPMSIAAPSSIPEQYGFLKFKVYP